MKAEDSKDTRRREWRRERRSEGGGWEKSGQTRRVSRRMAASVCGCLRDRGKADCPAGMMPNGEPPEALLAVLGGAGAWEMLPACPTVRTPTPITGAPRTPAPPPRACKTLPKTLATADETSGHTTAVRHRRAASMNLEDALICMHCRRANSGRFGRMSGPQDQWLATSVSELRFPI